MQWSVLRSLREDVLSYLYAFTAPISKGWWSLKAQTRAMVWTFWWKRSTKHFFERCVEDSSFNRFKKVNIAHYHLEELNWPVSYVSLQCIMHDFIMNGHIYVTFHVVLHDIVVLCDITKDQDVMVSYTHTYVYIYIQGAYERNCRKKIRFRAKNTNLPTLSGLRALLLP